MGLALLSCSTLASAGDGTWTNPAGGHWDDSANWSGAVPSGPGDVASFGLDNPVGDAIVLLPDVGTVVGRIEDANRNELRIIGGGTLILDQLDDGGPVTIDLDRGKLQIDSAVDLPNDDLVAQVADSRGRLLFGGAIGGVGGVQVNLGHVDLDGINTFAGMLQVGDGAVVGIGGPTFHGGTRVRSGGQLLVRENGSLVGAGQVTVDQGGELGIVRPAGADPFQNSVSLGGVVLNNGTISLQANIDPSGLLAPASSAGTLALDRVTQFTGGAANVIDFAAIGGSGLRLGAKTLSTIPPGVSLVPESTSNTLRFGGAPGTLMVKAPLVDVGGQAVHIEQAAGGTTVLAAANTHTGTTTVRDGTLIAAHHEAFGQSPEVAVLAGGTLQIRSGFTAAANQVNLDGGRLSGDTTGRSVLDGPVELLSDSVLTNASPSGTLRIAGPIGGTGEVQVDQGIVDLLGANTFTGPLRIEGAEVRIIGPSGNGATEVGEGGRLMIWKAGSMVAAGPITVHEGGQLRVVEPAGTDPETNSLAPGNVLLDGGTLILAKNDFDPAGLLAPAASTGLVALQDQTLYTAGGTYLMDFDTIGSPGANLGATTDSTIALGVTLLPDRTSHTLRLGGGPAKLIIEGTIADADGVSTDVDVESKPGDQTQTVLAGASTYTGVTHVRTGSLVARHATALGTGAGKTVVHAGATLKVRTSLAEPFELAGGTIDAQDAILSGPIELTDNSKIWGTSERDPIELEGLISGSGDLELRSEIRSSASEALMLRGDNTYTGQTTITGGKVVVTSPIGLGDTAVGTVVRDSVLELRAPTAEPLRIEQGGRVKLVELGGNYSGPLTFDEGELFMAYETTIASPIVVESGGAKIYGYDSTWTGTATGTGNVRLGGNLTVDGLLAHDGDVVLDLAVLNTANTYTGQTLVTGGEATVNHPAALGTSLDPIHIEQGVLTLNVVPNGNRDFTVVRGTLNVQTTAAPIASTITLGEPDMVGHATASEIGGVGRFTGQIFLASPIDNALTGGTFEGTIVGAGDLDFWTPEGAVVNLNAPNRVTGISRVNGHVNLNHAKALDLNRVVLESSRLDLNVPAEGRAVVVGGRLVFNSPQQLDHPWMVQDGTVDASVEIGMQKLIFREGGGLKVNDGGSVRIDNELLVMRQAVVGDGLAGSGTVRLAGNRLQLLGDLSNFDGDIHVDSGQFEINDVASETFTGALHVNNGASAAFEVYHVDFVADFDIFLHNAKESWLQPGRGALHQGSGAADALLRGRLDVGDQGSAISGGFVFEGNLTGSNLTLLYGELEIRSPQHDLEGVLRAEDGDLVLDDQGELHGLAAIELDNGGDLSLRNSPAGADVPSDRVGDEIEIRSWGGRIFFNPAPAITATETLGTVRLERARTTIGGSGELGLPDPTLTVNELEREPGATVWFEAPEGFVAIANPPPLSNGMIGPWALTKDGFATIGPDGRIETVASTATDLNAAGPTDHLFVTEAQVLSADAEVASLMTGYDQSIDLGGHQLTIGSGGIRAGAVSIVNGELTAGDSGPAELVVSADRNGWTPIGANLIDNATGNSVALVIDAAKVRLSGSNSYTGGTWVMGTLAIEDLSAVPANDRVHVDNGSYDIRLQAETTVALAALHLREGGWVESAGAAVDAAEYFLEEGEIHIPLRGDGAIVKTTDGTVRLSVASPDFSGSVLVRDGILDVAGNGLGSAPIRVEGGELNGGLGNLITLDGGILGTGRYTGEVAIEGDSQLLSRGTVNVEGNLTGTGNLTLNGVTWGSFLKVYTSLSGDNSQYSGDISIESGVLWVPVPGAAGTGVITVGSGAKLVLGGKDSDDPPVVLDNRVDLFGGSLIGKYCSGGCRSIVNGDVTVHGESFVGGQQEDGLTFAGRLELADDAYTFTIGDRRNWIPVAGQWLTVVSGQLLVGANTTWDVQISSVDIRGTIESNAENASIDFVGIPRLIGLDGASVHVRDGQSLTLLRSGQPLPLALAGDTTTVTGNGTLRSHLSVADAAAIAPGESTEPIGFLSIDGDLTIADGGRLAIELGGTVRGETYDALDVLGQAVLDGVVEVRLSDDFAPQPGTQFDILAATGEVTGRFADQTMPPLGAGLAWNVLYDTGAIGLKVVQLGDVNLDGVVNGLDVDPFVGVLIDGPFQGEADMNLDGVVNGLDVDPFVAAVTGGAQAVPEPSTAALLAMLVLLLLGWSCCSTASSFSWRRV